MNSACLRAKDLNLDLLRAYTIFNSRLLETEMLFYIININKKGIEKSSEPQTSGTGS